LRVHFLTGAATLGSPSSTILNDGDAEQLRQLAFLD
jgi:hypothetical protein